LVILDDTFIYNIILFLFFHEQKAWYYMKTISTNDERDSVVQPLTNNKIPPRVKS